MSDTHDPSHEHLRRQYAEICQALAAELRLTRPVGLRHDGDGPHPLAEQLAQQLGEAAWIVEAADAAWVRAEPDLVRQHGDTFRWPWPGTAMLDALGGGTPQARRLRHRASEALDWGRRVLSEYAAEYDADDWARMAQKLEALAHA